jgi:hypothetical protein
MKKTNTYVYLLYVAVICIIFIPLAKPGYLFLTDMVIPPNRSLELLSSYTTTNAFPLKLFEFVLSVVVTTQVAQKLMLASILLLAACAGFHLARRYVSSGWAATAGLVYMLNPYVYERFLAGHWFVLLGYAYFPILLYWLLQLFDRKDRRSLVMFSLAYAMYPWISLHWWYIASGFIACVGLVYIVMLRNGLKKVKQSAVVIVLTLIASFLVLNWFWILPTMNGTSPVEAITIDDLSVYSTLPDKTWGVTFNVLSLYGFWIDYNLLPKDMNSWWWILTFIMLGFSSLGLYSLARKKDPLAIATALLFIPIVLLTVGYESDYSRPLTEWLFVYFPGYKGLRETAKLVGVIAFTYAIYMPVGIHRFTVWHSAFYPPRYRHALSRTLLALAFAVPVLLVNSMFWGFNGQLVPGDYPQEWYQINDILKQQQIETLLILPWQGYMAFPFTQNRYIANPGKWFFNANTYTGTSIVNQRKQEKITTFDGIVNNLKGDETNVNLSLTSLQSEGIYHIVVLKTGDFRKYGQLGGNNRLTPLYESSSIDLYAIQSP